jgi:hypothetical protein
VYNYLLIFSFIFLCILFALVFINVLPISFLCVTCCVCTSVFSVLVYFSVSFIYLFIPTFIILLRCFLLPFTVYSICCFYITSPSQKLNEYSEQTALENREIWLSLPAKVGILYCYFQTGSGIYTETYMVGKC